MNSTRFVCVVGAFLEVVVAIWENNNLGDSRPSHCPNNALAVEQLAHFLRCRRHKLNFSHRSVLSGTADKGPGNFGALNPDGASDGRQDPERDTRKDQMIKSCEALAQELLGEALSK